MTRASPPSRGLICPQRWLRYLRMLSSNLLPLTLLGDPIRVGLLEHLSSGAPCGLDELARAANVHANTVRSHLAPLEDARVVVREHEQTGLRGRPSVRYRLAEGWRLPSQDFGGLAGLLASVLAAIDPDPERLQALGEEWGRWLAGRPGARDVRAAVSDAMAALGFKARVNGEVVELGECPCAAVLPDRPELVCRLAAAVVGGAAAASRQRRVVRGGVHDPEARRCHLRLGVPHTVK
jgi:predicted ArsR family transcriptional regulator